MSMLLKQVEISQRILVKLELQSWSLGPWSWAVQGTPYGLGDCVPQEPVLCHCSLLLVTRCCNEQKCCGTMVLITRLDNYVGICDPLQPSAAITPGNCTVLALAMCSSSPYSSLCQRKFNNLTQSPIPRQDSMLLFNMYLQTW